MDNEQILQGIAAIKAGDKYQARQLLIAAIKQNPRDEEAWFGLYDAVETEDQRTRCLQEILRINPDNVLARKLLEQRQAAEETRAVALPQAGTPPSEPTSPAPVQTAECLACRAPLAIPPDVGQIQCASCGLLLGVQRNAGWVILKPVKKVPRNAQASRAGARTAARRAPATRRQQARRAVPARAAPSRKPDRGVKIMIAGILALGVLCVLLAITAIVLSYLNVI